MENRVYIDESGINQYVYREYGRAPRGEKVFGEVSGKRFSRESFIAGLCEGKFVAPICFEGTCTTSFFNVWLEKVLIPELSPGKVIILDNASFHRSEESKRIVEKAGCQLLFLPAYSPDLNPIEKFWANLKAKIRELLRSAQTLGDAIDGAFATM